MRRKLSRLVSSRLHIEHLELPHFAFNMLAPYQLPKARLVVELSATAVLILNHQYHHSIRQASRVNLANMATTDVAMDDMEIDFTMDTEEDPEIARLQAEAAAINAVCSHILLDQQVMSNIIPTARRS